jgi:hypothetical protein
MPLQPLSATLTDGQKIDVLKRFRKRYGDELEKVENSLLEIMTALAEADFMVQYVGDQPEVRDLRARKAEIDALELRRQYLGKLIDRLDAVIPAQPEVHAPLPGSSTPARPGLRRY